MIAYILAFFLIVLLWRQVVLRRTLKDERSLHREVEALAHSDLAASRLRYYALEQGMNEQSDAYEQEFLSQREKIEDLEAQVRIQNIANLNFQAENENLSNIVKHHTEHCLPTLVVVPPERW
jgi:flagellar biosynthesis/type III secretory pathway M-ring protein FliF/YscJ